MSIIRIDRHKVKRDFDRAAAHYEKHADIQSDVQERLLQLAMPYLPPAPAVLDAGCGTGRLAGLLRQQRLGAQVMGCDLAEGMCRQSQMRGIAVTQARVEALPYKPIFDAVFCSLVLQWVEPLHPAFSECFRVLKPGGKFILASFGPDTLVELKEAFAAIDSHPHVSQFRTAGETITLLEEAGFNLLEAQCERHMLHYADMNELAMSLRKMGAVNKHPERRRTTLTKGQWQKAERIYREKFASEYGLPASWDVYYLIVEKPNCRPERSEGPLETVNERDPSLRSG